MNIFIYIEDDTKTFDQFEMYKRTEYSADRMFC